MKWGSMYIKQILVAVGILLAVIALVLLLRFVMILLLFVVLPIVVIVIGFFIKMKHVHSNEDKYKDTRCSAIQQALYDEINKGSKDGKSSK